MKTATRTASTIEIIKAAAPRIALSFGMALVIALSARISFLTPVSVVPVTLQVAAVLLAGFLLGPRWGAASVAQYIGMGLLGAPVFAMGLGGPAVVLSPSFGYILAFIAAAWLVGLMAERTQKNFIKGLGIAALGVVVIYLGGMLWLAGYMIAGGAGFGQGLLASWSQGVAPFIVVDALKAVLVSGIWTVFRR